VIAILCAVAAVVGAWLALIQPKRDQASKLGSQVTAAQTQLDSARALVAQSEAARATFARSYTELARLGQAVPPDDNVPSLIYQLQGAANGAGVDFRALVLNPSSSTATPVPTGAGAGAKTAAPAGSAQAAQALTPLLPPGAAVGPAGFPAEQFTFSFQGNFFHLANFFKRLQNFVVATNKQVSVSGRLMTLNAFSLGPATQGFPAITASISATTYLVPAAQGLFNGATPVGPGAASAQSASTTRSSSPIPTAAITP
jgi:hypothetical protein